MLLYDQYNNLQLNEIAPDEAYNTTKIAFIVVVDGNVTATLTPSNGDVLTNKDLADTAIVPGPFSKVENAGGSTGTIIAYSAAKNS